MTAESESARTARESAGAGSGAGRQDAGRRDAGRDATEREAAAVVAAGGHDTQSLEAGRVGRPHGLDGSFYVTGARPRLLALGTRVTLAGRALEIVRCAGVEQRPIVRLAGIEDRTAVEALRGQTLSVPLAQAPALAPGEWWGHELEGCAVVDGARSVGVVGALLEFPSCEVLQVRRGDGAELLVPMVGDAIRAIDVAERRVEIDLAFLGET